MQALKREGQRLEKNGILVLDKPEGMTSARAVGRIKRLIGARKAGHAGTLDPFATGVLVVMLNQATRLGRFLLAGDKSYAAVLHLGVETDTQDSTGQICRRHIVAKGIEARLMETFRLFEGDIAQRPPVFSALKHKGVPLYKLARQGRPVQKPARRVHISALQIKAVELPEVHFDVTCSAGTYIRSLCADIGQTLGCGGHLSSLRRTASSGFGLADAIRLESLEAQMQENIAAVPLVSPAKALASLPTRIADGAIAAKVNRGLRLTTDDLLPPEPQMNDLLGPDDTSYCKIVDSGGDLLAVVQFQTGKKQYDYCCVFPHKKN